MAMIHVSLGFNNESCILDDDSILRILDKRFGDSLVFLSVAVSGQDVDNDHKVWVQQYEMALYCNWNILNV